MSIRHLVYFIHSWPRYSQLCERTCIVHIAYTHKMRDTQVNSHLLDMIREYTHTLTWVSILFSLLHRGGELMTTAQTSPQAVLTRAKCAKPLEKLYRLS